MNTSLTLRALQRLRSERKIILALCNHKLQKNVIVGFQIVDNDSEVSNEKVSMFSEKNSYNPLS